MKRTLIIGGVLLTLLVGSGVLIWYVSYATTPAPPRSDSVVGLSQPATIHWQPNGVPRIEAADRADALAALGYAHGTQRLWTLALWRQTALGRLGEWFGRGVLPLDRHARRLGLGPFAASAYAALPDSTQQWLAAYAAGINAALDAEAHRRHDALVLLDRQPLPWKPWHTLAIERLVGWLATTPPPDSVRAALPAPAQRFFQADRRFRQWLHIHGLERSVAWITPTPDGPALFQRHVFGTSALPPFQPVWVDEANRAPRMGATLPGTPFFPTGRAGRTAWALLLHSPLDLTFAPVDSSALRTTYDRIRFRDGGEALLTIQRLPGTLPLTSPDPRPIRPEALPDTLSPADSAAAIDSIRTRRRSVWQVRWPGFTSASDASTWLTRGAPTAPFQLLSGNGLRLPDAGTWSVLGTPPVEVRTGDGILVGHTPWARTQALNLNTPDDDAPPPIAALSTSDTSAWAAREMTRLMPFLLAAPPADSLVRTAITYLRNWDYGYDRASIGASVFETWLRTHRTATDSLPFMPPRPPPAPPDDSLAYVQWVDSLQADSLRRGRALQRTLQQAVDTLATRFGAVPRRWRWERINASQRRFPVWSADSLVERDGYDLSDTRYAPIERPGRGHPSALSGGTSLLDADPPAAAAWEAWTGSGPDAPFMMRHPQFRNDTFLGRYTMPDRRPPPIPLLSDTTTATTVLRPPS